MMKVLLRAVLVGWMLPFAFWAPASASRAEMDGRGLPRLLADDPTNLRLLPGSAFGFPSQFLADLTLSSGPPDIRYIGSQSDRFAAALIGNGTRAGYLLDGQSHNLLVGLPARFGMVIGFSDAYDETEQYRRQQFNDLVQESFSHRKSSDTQIRAALGWSLRLGEQRTLSVAVAGTRLESEVISEEVRYSDGELTRDDRVHVISDPGFGWEATLQTLTTGTGLLAAAQYIHIDRAFDAADSASSRWRSQRASLDLGWRWTPEILDDLVFGWTSFWSKEETPYDRVYAIDYAAEATEEYFQGGLFVSGEKRILESLVARAGVQATGYFRETAQNDTESQEGLSTIARYTSSEGLIQAPQFFLGAGWSWKRLRLDAQLRENIDLSNPVVRWSAVVFW